MPFVTKNFYFNEPIKAIAFLQKQLNTDIKTAQKIIDKHRIKMNGNLFLDKAGFLIGRVELSYFEPTKLPIYPIFQTNDFAFFDKPPKLLTHPKGKFHHTSLLDAIRFYLGREANPIHRLDSETSGILLVSKHKQSEIKLKKIFQNREVKKTYLAYVYGKMQDSTICFPLKEQDKTKDLGIKSLIDKNGKNATTQIKLISYDKKNDISLVEAVPITGRTHQIRAHLAHIGHRILGESLYGIKDELARDFLDKKIQDIKRKKLFGAERLMLHSYSLCFHYNKNTFYITSKMGFDKL